MMMIIIYSPLPHLQPARLPSCMESLNLHGCEEVDDESLSVLSMPHLTTLNLAFAVITDDGLMTLVEVSRSHI